MLKNYALIFSENMKTLDKSKIQIFKDNQLVLNNEYGKFIQIIKILKE
jgi:hypothetical protein